MTSGEFSEYEKFFAQDTALYTSYKRHYFFLETSVENCRDRITRRSRVGESKISEDYLKNLEHRYNELKIREKMFVLNGDNCERTIFKEGFNAIVRCLTKQK